MLQSGLQKSHSGLFQEAFQNGLQSYVKSSNVLTATSALPITANSTFYSTIVGRAPIPDITADLRASFGIERISTQSPVLIQSETGPNSEQVWGVLNDDRSLIRFVGGSWANTAQAGIGSDGQAISEQTNNPAAYAEITFYGTGLNILTSRPSNRTAAVSIDGGAETTIPSWDGTSSVISTRGYSTNTVVSVASGLSLGVHTVKIRSVGNGTSGANLVFAGIEIVNANSTTNLNINPGTAYIDGLRAVASSAQSSLYNSSFETGTLGARGGHAVVYLKTDGTVGKAVTPTNSASAFLTAADHTNEELLRVYNHREFGAARTDDFSAQSNSSAGFTLDDGTTSLIGNLIGLSNNYYGPHAVAFSNAGFVTLTFVGTGVDVIAGIGGSAVGTATVFIDGTSVGNITLPAAASIQNIKLASGLPYGTHTARIVYNGNGGLGVIGYRVYQPKKPSIPAGTIELADYNVMASYVADGVATTDTVSTGVLFKQMQREMIYTGTWSTLALSTATNGPPAGWYSQATSAAAVQYTFFGTGVEIISGGTSSTATVKIDGSNYAGAATAAGSGSWTPGTSTWGIGTTNGNKLQITGLSLGLHTITVTWASGTWFFHGFNVITPIHSGKSNLGTDLQNALTVGSCALSDNRKTSLLPAVSSQKKNVVKVVGVGSTISTTSTVLVPMADMQTVFVSSGGMVEINFTFSVYNSVNAANPIYGLFIDGVLYDAEYYGYGITGNQITYSLSTTVNLSAGAHMIAMCWRVSSGTLISGGPNNLGRVMTVKQL